ncbi:MAG: hypothetical protein V1728_01015 [Candidatus Micrarchaeota archaeon]
MWILKGSRQKIYADIASGRHSGESEVFLKTKPSRALLLRLLNHAAVRRIHLSPGLLATVPPKVRSALEQSGVQIQPVPTRAGRPDKYDNEKKEEARRLIGQGKGAKEISKKTGLPTTAIYYYKLKMGEKKDHPFPSASPDST